MIPQSSCNTPIPPCVLSFHLFGSYQLGCRKKNGSRERPRLKQPQCPQSTRPITHPGRAPNASPFASLITVELEEVLRGNRRHNCAVRMWTSTFGEGPPVRPFGHTPTFGLSYPFVPHSSSQPLEGVYVRNISIQWIGLMGEKGQKNIG